MPSGNNEYGSKAVLPRDRFTIHILYSFFTEKPRPSGRGFFVSILIHPQLALLCRRDYFFCPDSSLSCSFSPQGLFLPPGFISILLFSSAGIISAARIHLYLALFHRRDYFFCADASLSCSFVLQGLFLLLRCIPSLLFFSAGIISSAQMHLYLALFLHRDYCDRSDSSLSCSFLPQGLFPPPGFIPSLLFSSAGIISAAQMHLYLALFFRRDYFRHPDSSLSCSSVLQGLLPPPGFISILLFFTAGITSSARIHPYLALFFRRDYFFRPDSSLEVVSLFWTQRG